MNLTHVPVLKKEALQYLNVGPNKNFVDATIGGGGHTTAILEKNGPAGTILGIEVDPVLYQKLQCLKLDFKQRLILVNGSYRNLEKIVKNKKFGPVHGVLFDLGLSSWHLDESGRGFSFLRDELLDMRYHIPSFGRSSKIGDGLTAAVIVNDWPPEEIEKILKEYSEERFAKRIAKAIVNARKKEPIISTFQLVDVIKQAVPKNYQRGRLHPATRTFQALRIVVNNELENLEKALPQTLKVLEPQGRLVVISYHSLEDRIVKNFFKNKAKENLLKILTKKPIRPAKEKVEKNPRSRSAKLRAAQKS